MSDNNSLFPGGGCGKDGLREYFRELARSNLYFFAKAILGYDKLRWKSHGELCRLTQDLTCKRQLALLPRGTYKTTIRTKSFAPWVLINNPNAKILIANQTARNAEIMLQEIEQHFDGSNSLMNWLFPEYIKPNDRWKPWSSEMMTVPCRTAISGTPSIMTIGTGGRAESLHFDYIITDDLIGEKAMESDKEMLDAVVWHDNVNSLFVSPKDGIERMSGTRWSLSDLYSSVMDNPDYKIYWKAAEDPKTGELFFPELLDHDTLLKIKTNNYALYMSQYQNDPENPAALEFQRSWLHNYYLINKKGEPACETESGEVYYVKDMDVVLAVDPAGSGDVENRLAEALKRGRARKSNNAVEIWGLHGSGKYFLLDLWAGRGVGKNPELQVAEQMLKMFRAWRGYVRAGFVESYGAQRALITIFNMLLTDSPESYRVEEIPRGIQKAKKVRIRSYLGGPGQNGLLYIRPGHEIFRFEFGKFPQSDMMDTLDAGAWAVHSLRRPRSAVESKVVRESDSKAREDRIRVIGRGGY